MLEPSKDAFDRLISGLAEESGVHWKGSVLAELLRLAREGHSEIYSGIGAAYESGTYEEGVSLSQPRPDLAYRWYRRAIFEAGDTEGYYGAGRMLFYGLGDVEKDMEQGLRYLVLAYEGDVALAGIALGEIYFYGKFVERDLVAAQKFLTKPAELGYVRPMLTLAKIKRQQGFFREGWIVYLKAVVSGIKIVLSNRQMNLLYGLDIGK